MGFTRWPTVAAVRSLYSCPAWQDVKKWSKNGQFCPTYTWGQSGACLDLPQHMARSRSKYLGLCKLKKLLAEWVTGEEDKRGVGKWEKMEVLCKAAPRHPPWGTRILISALLYGNYQVTAFPYLHWPGCKTTFYRARQHLLWKTAFWVLAITTIYHFKVGENSSFAPILEFIQEWHIDGLWKGSRSGVYTGLKFSRQLVASLGSLLSTYRCVFCLWNHEENQREKCMNFLQVVRWICSFEVLR